MNLNELSDKPGANHRRKRVGRGPGSGLGKTGGRGMKGQKSRSGVAIKGFEGGQMPIHRRLPKRGFTSIFKKRFAVINLDGLQDAVDRGALDASQPVTEAVLLEKGVIRRVRDGVRVLGRGELKQPLTIDVTGASKGAIEAVEKAGGTLKVKETASAAEA